MLRTSNASDTLSKINSDNRVNLPVPRFGAGLVVLILQSGTCTAIAVVGMPDIVWGGTTQTCTQPPSCEISTKYMFDDGECLIAPS